MRKRKSIFLVVSLILFISIGFSVLSSNISINGSFSFLNNTWDIYFDNLEVSPGSVAAIESAKIMEEDNETINYEIKFTKPGDYYEFNVDIVNDGTIDAMISNITKSPLNEEQQKYLDYVVSYENGDSILENDIVRANGSVRIKIIVSFKTDISAQDLPVNGDCLNLSLSTDAIVVNEI